MNIAFCTRISRMGLAALALVSAAMAAPRLASAGEITFELPTVSPVPPGIGFFGFFDVTVTDTTTDPLAQFQADVFVNPGASGIQFISADVMTTAPYVIQPTSNSQLISTDSPLFWDANEASNNDGTNVGLSSIGPSPEAIMRIEYEIPAGTPAGTYPLTFNQDNPYSDPFASYVNTVSNTDTAHYQSPDVFINGAIVITPEPSAVLLAALGAVGLLGIGLRRIRRR